MSIYAIPARIDDVIGTARREVREYLLEMVAGKISESGDIEAGRRLLVGYAREAARGCTGQVNGSAIYSSLMREEALSLADYHDLHYLSFDYRKKEIAA